jgi:hypothetical protein
MVSSPEVANKVLRIQINSTGGLARRPTSVYDSVLSCTLQ